MAVFQHTVSADPLGGSSALADTPPPSAKTAPKRHHARFYPDLCRPKAIRQKSEGFGKLLYSAKYDLRGKPDYIFKKRLGGATVPVELKSGSIKDDPLPHPGDLLQLAAYFLLLEDIYGKRPPYGWLKYSDYMFYVRNTRKIRKEVKQTMADMRKMLEDGEGTPNASFVNCRHCICNGTVCPYGQYHRNGGEV